MVGLARSANKLPGNPERGTGMTLENYLTHSFNHGVSLGTLFGYGIGSTLIPHNPFKRATQGNTALDTYRTFLAL